MKKALVISFLLVAGLGLAAFAGPLSGSWSISGNIGYTDEGQVAELLVLNAFYSTLVLDYTTCGWTFSSTADFDKHDFTNLYFEGTGAVGAFGFYGVLDFIPQTPSFDFLIGFVDLSIAGVTAYAGGGIRNFDAGIDDTPNTGVGFVVGGFGVAGDCSVWVEAQFNFSALIGSIEYRGYDATIARTLYYDTYLCAEVKPGYNVQTAGCTAAWSGLDVYVRYPFACFDLLTTVAFDCEVGFDEVCFKIDDICTGLDWLLLDDLDICFNVQTKSVCGQFELVLGDCLCFTPYLSLVMDGDHGMIDGIQLNALTIEYDMGQGVTFKAGTLFNNSWGNTGFAKIDDDATCDSDDDMCWDSDGGLTDVAGCCIDATYDEYFAILVDGDACCGGAFSVEVFNWFEDEQTDSFMDWEETEVDISIGIGSNTTLSVGFDLDMDGLDNMGLGVKFTF